MWHHPECSLVPGAPEELSLIIKHKDEPSDEATALAARLKAKGNPAKPSHVPRPQNCQLINTDCSTTVNYEYICHRCHVFREKKNLVPLGILKVTL